MISMRLAAGCGLLVLGACEAGPLTGPAGPASALAFRAQPMSTAAGTGMPAVLVHVEDSSGKTVTSAANSITLTLRTNPAGQSLPVTATAIAVSGVATFPSLMVDRPGRYTWEASTDGLTGARSAAFSITVTFASLTAGGFHTCGLSTSGRAYCWGENFQGQLGTGPPSSSRTTAPAPVAGGLTFSAISAGWFHTCGRTAAGAAYCWGGNPSGELGNGSSTTSGTPVPVSGGIAFSAVVASNSHSCGISTEGTSYCWGENVLGGLGDGTTTVRRTPVAVSGGLVFAVITGGRYFTCGVTADGTPYCWGSAGQLGNGGMTDSKVPTTVSGTLKYSVVSAAWDHTCGRTTAGSVYCWGFNGDGQLGNGTTNYSGTPVRVSGGISYTTVAAGFNHTCGIASSGRAYCWGSNQNGQLGDGTTTAFNFSTFPVLVAGDLMFSSVTGGANHTCGLATSGVAYCWGSNTNGQLGRGDGGSSAVPVAVVQ